MGSRREREKKEKEKKKSKIAARVTWPSMGVYPNAVLQEEKNAEERERERE
jgi:hypothetical protein